MSHMYDPLSAKVCQEIMEHPVSRTEKRTTLHKTIGDPMVGGTLLQRSNACTVAIEHAIICSR